MNTPKLQVMICTCRREGLARVAQMQLPELPEVGYIVSCQSDPIAIPDTLIRSDVIVAFSPTKGLSNNRNAALDLVTASYALIADDDLTFIPSGLQSIIQCFDRDPALDVATFMCDFPQKKVYPPTEHDLSRQYKNYNVASVEIALRISAIRAHSLRFSTLLGLGAPYLQSAEEQFFLLDCLHKGLKCRFFPTLIARHPADSTGTRLQDSPGVLRANGAYILKAYPLTAILRIPLKAYRTRGSTLRNLLHLIQGAIYIVKSEE